MKNKLERATSALMILQCVMIVFVNLAGLNVCSSQPKLVDLFIGSTLDVDYNKPNTLLVVREFEGSERFNPFAIDPDKPSTVIGAIFNEAFADSLICLKINEVRFYHGLSMVSTSGKLRKFVSQKHSATMVKENKLFHPGHPKTVEFSRQLALLAKEFSKINDNYQVIYGSDSIPSYGIDEIAIKICSQPNTYEELAERCVEGWLNSPPHNAIMLQAGYTGYHHKYRNLLCGVSIKKSGNAYYGCVNYIEF